MVTVILSAYNAEKYIAKSIESVLNQTFSDFEFIIIEDKSTDKTLEIIETYAAKDDRIRLIKRDQNNGFQGYVRNLNQMISEAKGAFIAKFDADDIWVEDKLEKQVKDLEQHPEVFLLSANAIEINEEGNPIGKVIRPTQTEEIHRMIVHSNPFCHPSILFRNQGYFYREKMFYTEEYDLYLRMFSDGKNLAHRGDFLFYYRILDNSMSRGNKTLIQALFKQKAIEFFHQRQKLGTDQYEEFNPQDYLEILNPNYKNSITDLKQALRLAFVANLKSDYLTLLRKSIEQYSVMSFLKYLIISKFYSLVQKIYSR